MCGDGQSRPADHTGPVDVAGGDEAAVLELGDEAGHGGLVQAGRGGELRPRARPVVPQVPQDQAQVASADGGLVGRRAPGSDVGEPAESGHVVPSIASPDNLSVGSTN